MTDTFEKILREVEQNLEVSSFVANTICEILGQAMKVRRDTYGHSMINDAHINFHLMVKMGYVDSQEKTLMDHRDRSSHISTGHRLRFLSAKAIRLHRDLCYEGYYGFEENP